MSTNDSIELRSIVQAPSLKILPKEHFWISGLKREFELTAIVPLYIHVLNNIDELPRNISLELSIGSSTIIYKIDNAENIHLITGWLGSRNSKKNSLPYQSGN